MDAGQVSSDALECKHFSDSCHHNDGFPIAECLVLDIIIIKHRLAIPLRHRNDNISYHAGFIILQPLDINGILVKPRAVIDIRYTADPGEDKDNNNTENSKKDTFVLIGFIFFIPFLFVHFNIYF